MATAFYGDPISERLSRSPENFLIAQAARLCRSGWQQYRSSELDLPGSGLINVYRPPEEVIADAFLASLEGKCLVDDHPRSDWVSSSNARFVCIGHAQNIRQGKSLSNGDITIVGDLFVIDESVIRKIAAGKRELSVGYSYRLLSRGDGTYEMRDLVANHVAIVDCGRAGSEIRILDHAITESCVVDCCPREQARIASSHDDEMMAQINFLAATKRYLGKDIMQVAAQRRNGKR